MKSLWTLVWCFSTLFLFGQDNEIPEVTKTYLIKNANIVQKPGMVMEGGSILVEDGLIKQVGKNIVPPFDAMVIDVDSMFIYAGFIDAASHVGIPKKEEEQNQGRRRGNRVINPTYTQSGVTPEILASSVFDPSDKSINDHRKAGFTLAHVVPEGRMLSGKGAIMTLGEGSAAERIVKDETSVFAQWKTSRQGFPGTTIGIISKWRDVYHNAKNMADYQKKYEMNPKGMPRPKMEEAIASFIPVVKDRQPVFFAANKVLDVHRVLNLQEELGFNLVLTEVEQLTPVMDVIKSKNIPLLVSIDLPKEMKEEKKKEDEESEEDKVDPMTQKLMDRKKEAYNQYMGQFAALEKSGVKFGFSFVDTKVKDFLGNARRMIDAGLTENAALEAVTTTPASMLGVGNVYGTIEPGKAAHMIVSTKPIFDKDANIKHVFVDGVKYDFEVKEKKKKKKGDSDEATAMVGGKWSYEIEIPGMTRGGFFKITQDGGEVSISMSSEESPDDYLDCTDVVLDGTNLTFSAAIAEGGMNFNLSFDLEVDGEDIEGNVDVGQFGSFPVTGSQVEKPE